MHVWCFVCLTAKGGGEQGRQDEPGGKNSERREEGAKDK